eukprot:m.238796 g.238796  ORF g.238796 m.238796 type:complete len:531 (+) comp19399_c0_seq3:197-1789(+)
MEGSAGTRTCVAEFCKKDITNVIHIACATCENFEMCLHCFSVGHEQDDHLNNHPYRVIDNMKFSLYDEQWGADEELRLLQVIQSVGLGNWQEISSRMGTKSAEECEQHYLDCYLSSKTAPLPDASRMLQSNTDASGGASRQTAGETATIAPPPVARSTGAKASKAPRNKKQMGKMMPLKRSASCASGTTTGVVTVAAAARPAPVAEQLPPVTLGQSYAGYYPNRKDFEQEHDEYCERPVAGITFHEDDGKLDIRLKTTLLRIYNAKLNKRQQRKDFCISHGLVGKDRIKTYRQNRDFKMQFDRLRPLLRFHPAKDFDALLDALYHKAQLQRKVRMYQEYRKAGLSKFKQISQYTAEKKRFLNKDSKEGKHGKSRGGRPSATVLANVRRVAPSTATDSRLPLLEDFLKLPCAKMFSNNEIDLCHSVSLLPSQYFSLKMAFLRHNTRFGFLTFEGAKRISPYEAARTAKVYAFAVECGWIHPGDAAMDLLGEAHQHSATDTRIRAHGSMPGVVGTTPATGNTMASHASAPRA